MIPGLNKRVFNFYDLMLYVALVRKHLRLMALLICAALMAAVAVYVYERPVYYSRSVVRLDLLGLPLDTDKVYHDGNVYAVVNELKGPAVVERTAKTLGITAEYRDILEKYLRNLKIEQTSDGNLEVEVWSFVPSWPATWTQTMVDEFMKMRQEQREKFRDEVAKSYGDELGHLNEKIDENQESKFSFQDQSKFTQASIDLNRLQNLPADLARATKRLDELGDIRKRLDGTDLDMVAKLSLIESVDSESHVEVGQMVTSSKPDASATPSTQGAEKMAASDGNGTETLTPDSVVIPALVAEQGEWQKLEKSQRELLREYADLSRTYLPGNLKMQAVRKELDQTQKNLELDYDLARNRFDIEYRTAQEEVDTLEKRLPEYESVNRRFAKIQQDSQLHDAGQLAWASFYSEAAKRISELEYTSDKEKANLTFLEIKQLNKAPVAPNRTNLLLAGLLLGIVLAFGIPFLVEYLDYTLSNLEEVEATFQMRGLGIIPQVASESDRPMLLDVENSGPEKNLVENFRLVRTNLLAMGSISKPAHVVMVTSAMPKEGKTVISSNLAISFAQTGARTLLVDTDMRRGRLHRLFGLRKSPGLSDYLTDKNTLEECIRSSGKENLSILSAGQHMDSGTELLGAAKFSELMADLRTRYDRIIVDTPPVLGLSETSILQGMVDGVLFVIWSGRTPIRNMKTAVDILQANGANFYGFILNRLDLSATTNYYQYYYYSSSYYQSYHALENA